MTREKAWMDKPRRLEAVEIDKTGKIKHSVVMRERKETPASIKAKPNNINNPKWNNKSNKWEESI